MPSAIWTGTLSLGLVVVPVRLYPAIHKKAVRFRELDQVGRRVRHVRVSEPEVEFDAGRGAIADRLGGSEPVPIHQSDARVRSAQSYEPSDPEIAFDEIRKGFEVAPGQYVSMTREEVAALAPEARLLSWRGGEAGLSRSSSS